MTWVWPKARWVMDEATSKIYKVVWIDGRTIFLVRYDQAPIITTPWELKAHYKPLVTSNENLSQGEPEAKVKGNESP